MPRFPLRLASTLLFFAAPLLAVEPQMFTWRGDTDDNFTAATNWDSAGAPGTGNNLVFGDAERTDVFVPEATYSVNTFTFAGSGSNSLRYYFSGSGVSFTLLSGLGAPANAGDADVVFDSGISWTLDGAQAWNIAAGDRIELRGGVTSTSLFTKTDGGVLTLENASALSGGVTVSGGLLRLGTNLGGGTLTVQSDGAVGSTSYSGTTINVPVSLAHGAKLGNDSEFTTTLKLAGDVTVAYNAAGTDIELGADSRTEFIGTIAGSAANTAVRFTGGGVAVLAPTNLTADANVTNITAAGSAVIFENQNALPSGGIQAVNGYVGMGSAFDGTGTAGHTTASTLLAKITDQPNFTGTLGFDSAPGGEPTSFYSDVNVSAFASPFFVGLGSATHATLAGNLTFTGDYRFGGGGGRLMVTSNLNSVPAGLSVISPATDPLTVVLAGNNTFQGNVTVGNSFLIFDSSTAFPSAAGQTITLGSSGYIGATGTWIGTPNELLGKINASNLNATAVIGFDSSNPANDARPISHDIDLTILKTANPALAELPYLGTTTFGETEGDVGLVLSGAITVPTGMDLKLAGLNRGVLHIASNLGHTGGVIVGHPDDEIGADGTVVLSGANTYGGGTTFISGTLVIGRDSVKDGTITSGPLGTSTLVIPSGDEKRRIVRDSGADPVRTLHNDIELPLDHSAVLFGDPMITGSLVLDGAIIGLADLIFEGNATLSGSNNYQGRSIVRGTTLTVASDNGLGGGNELGGSFLELESTDSSHHATVNFTASTPAIAGLWSYSPDSTVDLASTTNLQIGKFDSAYDEDSYYSGTITGLGELTKSGAGILTLRGSNTYSGGTTINGSGTGLDGGIEVAHSGALGTSSVTVSGGDLGVQQDVTLSFTPGRTLDFQSGRLGGHGTFALDGAVNSLVIGTDAQLHPGFDMPGVLSFELSGGATLDLAGGGSLLWRLTDGSASTPGYGWSSVAVNGTVNISATNGSRFDIILGTVDPTQEESDFGTPDFFDYGSNGQWTLLSASSITYSSGVFDPLRFNLDTTNFTGAANGIFSIDQVGSNLVLNYTAVPEPSTWALIVGAAALGVAGVHRYRRRRA